MIFTQYPYIDEFGVAHNNLIKTYTNDTTKTLKQVETGALYDEAVDVYPCRYTYEEVDKEPENDTGENEERENNQ